MRHQYNGGPRRTREVFGEGKADSAKPASDQVDASLPKIRGLRVGVFASERFERPYPLAPSSEGDDVLTLRRTQLRQQLRDHLSISASLQFLKVNIDASA